MIDGALLDGLAEAVAAIGKEGPVARPCAGAVIVGPDGRVLRGVPAPWTAPRPRRPCPHRDGPWQYPKGGVDEGETPAQAAVREAREEACVVAVPVPGFAPVETVGRSPFRDSVGFGSPRLTRPGGVLCLAAARLLREAANRIGCSEADFEQHRYDWFDALLARGVQVRWRSVNAWHVLALVVEEPFTADEWCRRDWFDPTALRSDPRVRPGDPLTLLDAQGGAWLEAAARLSAEHRPPPA